jgi:hypothetical protein
MPNFREPVKAIYVFSKTKERLQNLIRLYPDITMVYFVDSAIDEAIDLELLRRKTLEANNESRKSPNPSESGSQSAGN